MRRILFVFCTVCAWAESGLEIPAIGATVDPRGFLRLVQGVAGNFWLGPEIASGVLSAACSEQVCLAKTESKLISLTGDVDAPSGPAIFGVDGGDAVIFFPESGTFTRWHDNALEPLDWTVDGEVLSVSLANGKVRIVVRGEGDGAVDSPVLLLAGGVVFGTQDEVVLRQADGTEWRFALAGTNSITRLGEHYAAIRTGDATYALRLDSGHEHLYVLPGNAP